MNSFRSRSNSTQIVSFFASLYALRIACTNTSGQSTDSDVIIRLLKGSFTLEFEPRLAPAR